MKATTFGKASAGVAAALALSLGVSSAAFATGVTATQEDPTTQASASDLVGVGSDTIQDVLYGLSNPSEGGITAIKSWTATGGTQITYRSGKVAPRPNGSGPGYKALTDSIGLTAAGNANAGDVDFSRASGTQGTAATGTTGLTTDIPFAIDSISFAVPTGSPFEHTNGGAGLTVTDLYNIYAGVKNEIDTTTGALGKTTAATPDSGSEFIQAFLPKGGSGSRQFFLTQIATQGTGITLGTNKGDSYAPSAGNPAPSTPYIGAKNPDGSDVQEHDASVLANAGSTVAAIAPFSGAKYIGYADGKIADPSKNGSAAYVAGTNYELIGFDSTVSGATNPVLPYTGTGTSLLPNPDYLTYGKWAANSSVTPATTAGAVTRQVYDIIPTAAVKGGGTSSNAKFNLLYKTFVGPTSDVCKAGTTIAAYGFLPMPTTGSGTLCGDTSKTFDATPSTATVTVSATPSLPGGNSTVTVNVQSNGNGGGKAVLTIAGASYTVTIPAGATSGTVTVPTPTAGTLAVTGTFTPNLAGVAPTQISGSITVAAASITSVKITGKAKIGKTVKAVVVTTPVGQHVTYQWMNGKKKIKHATKASLHLTNKLKVKGKKISVKVTLNGVSKTSKAVKVK